LDVRLNLLLTEGADSVHGFGNIRIQTASLAEQSARVSSYLLPGKNGARREQDKRRDNHIESLPVRVTGAVLAAAAGLALFLSTVGLYGILSLAWRHRDIGIRMALGASRGQVVALVVRDATRLVATASRSASQPPSP